MKRVKHSNTITDPKWYNLIFTGREGDDTGGDAGTGGSTDSTDSTNDEGGTGAEGGEGQGESEKDDNSGLKSALQKE